MRSDAIIKVTCDTCAGRKKYEEEFELCALAGKGEWDERYLEKQMIANGWKIIDGEDVCPGCVEVGKAFEENLK